MSTMANDRNSSAKSNSQKVDFLSLEGELKDGKVYFQGKSMSELAVGMDESSVAMSAKTEKALSEGASQVALSSPDHLYIYERIGSKIVLHTFKIPQALQSDTLKAMGLGIVKEKSDGTFEPVAIYGDDATIEFSMIPKALDSLTGKKHELEAVSLPKIEHAEKQEKTGTETRPQEKSRPTGEHFKYNEPPAYLLKANEKVITQPEKKAPPVNLVLNKEEPRPRVTISENTDQVKVTEHWHLKEKKRLLDPETSEKKAEVGQFKNEERRSNTIKTYPEYAERKSHVQIKRIFDNRSEASSQVNFEIRHEAKSDRKPKYEAHQETKIISQLEERRSEVRASSKDRVILNRPVVQTKEAPVARINYIRENLIPLKKTLREKVSVLKQRVNLPEPYNVFNIKESKLSSYKLSKDISPALAQILPPVKSRFIMTQSSRINLKNIPAPNLDSLSIETPKPLTKIQIALQKAEKFVGPFIKKIKENRIIQKAVSNLKLLAEKLISKFPQPVQHKLNVVFEKTRIVAVKLLNESVKQLRHFGKDIARVVQSAKNFFKFIFKAINRAIFSKYRKYGKEKKLKQREKLKTSVKREVKRIIRMRPKISRTIFAVPIRSKMSLNRKLKKKIKFKKRSGEEDLKLQEQIWNMMKKRARRKRKFIKY